MRFYERVCVIFFLGKNANNVAMANKVQIRNGNIWGYILKLPSIIHTQITWGDANGRGQGRRHKRSGLQNRFWVVTIDYDCTASSLCPLCCGSVSSLLISICCFRCHLAVNGSASYLARLYSTYRRFERVNDNVLMGKNNMLVWVLVGFYLLRKQWLLRLIF